MKAYIQTKSQRPDGSFDSFMTIGVDCKEDGRWQVYIGRFKSGEEQGIKEGEPFKTKREALGFAECCRELIDSVR